MIIPIILGALLGVAIALLIYASKENTQLKGEILQYRQSAAQLAMQIAKTYSAEDLADDAELLATVVFYTDIITGAELREGKSLEELTEYLKSRYTGRTELASKVISAATAHKFSKYQ